MGFLTKSVFLILIFYILSLAQAAGTPLISNEYHLILGPAAPYSQDVAQNEIVKQIEAILHKYSNDHSWQINSVSGTQVRSVSFFESAEGDLGKNSLILRKRGRLDKNAWTLKLRQNTDFNQNSVFEGAKIPVKDKLERDIQWIENGTEFTTYSESGNFEITEDFTNISQILETFPRLKIGTSLPVESPVRRILPVPILETNYTTAELIEPTSQVILTFETIFWTVENCQNRIIELSVKQMDGKDKTAVEAAIKEIYSLFPAQASSVSKTKLINTLCGTPQS